MPAPEYLWHDSIRGEVRESGRTTSRKGGEPHRESLFALKEIRTQEEALSRKDEE